MTPADPPSVVWAWPAGRDVGTRGEPQACQSPELGEALCTELEILMAGLLESPRGLSGDLSVSGGPGGGGGLAPRAPLPGQAPG